MRRQTGWIPHPALLLALAGIAGGLSAKSALAQNEPTPEETQPADAAPTLSDEELADQVERLADEREPGTVVDPDTGEPVVQARPGAVTQILGEIGEAQARLIGEGTFLPEARGVLVALSDGRVAMLFDEPANEDAEIERRLPPMVLVRSRHADAMERIWERTRGRVRLVISGRALIYHGTNYLLVTAPPRIERPASTSAPTPDQPPGVAPEGGTDEAPEVVDPEIAEMIRELENRAGPSRIAPREGSTGPKPLKTVGDDELRPPGGIPVREGAFVASRRARIVRATSGDLVAVFDTGTAAGADAQRETPMVLAPSLNLMRIERLIERGGADLQFNLSGEVLASNGRNHLLVTLFQVQRHGRDLMPLQ